MFKQIRVPDEGDLWRNGSLYYIVKKGEFLRLEFDIETTNAHILVRRIKDTKVTHYSQSCDVYEGVDGWTFIHGVWRVGVTDLMQKQIRSLQNYLEEAEKSVDKRKLNV